MKRRASLILILAMCFCLCACGGGPEEAGEIAYESIKEAAELADQFAEDVYEAWEFGLDHENELSDWCIEDVVINSSLSFNMDDLNNGAAYYLAELLEDDDWDDLSEDDQKHYINLADLVFSYMDWMDRSFAYGLADIAVYAYVMNGKLDEIEDNLKEAKKQLKKLSDEYPDYEPFDELKTYYVTVNTFLDFISEHNASGQELRSTIWNYKNDISNCEAELEYAFG